LYQNYVGPTKARYSLVGQGQCLDSAGALYDIVVSPILQAPEINAAYNWCLTATAYSSSFVGVEIDTATGNWLCDYDNGSIATIKVTDFTPTLHFVRRQKQCFC
jgi:hypothetical protein